VKVALVEYGAGNLPSVERALARLGVESVRAASPAGLASADAVILPGVGHFGALMRQLGAQGMIAPLQELIARQRPFLGICLGLQALFAASEEAPEDTGLAVFSSRVAALPATAKLPHMGWNQLQPAGESRLLEGISQDEYFYFAHTYAAMNADGASVATCDHGARFIALLERGNLCGVQFHPEKSGSAGAKLLSNFLQLAASATS
jgi:imidazole glycerol phosphate synthase glutamine amidotransferase subunit